MFRPRHAVVVLALSFGFVLVGSGSALAQGAPAYGGSATYTKPVDDMAPTPAPAVRPGSVAPFASDLLALMSGDAFSLRQRFVERVAGAIARPGAQNALKPRSYAAKRAALRLP